MSNNPAHKPEWNKLSDLASKVREKRIRNFFEDDTNRFDHFSLSLEELSYDFSKQHADGDVIKALTDLAKACDLEKKRDEMFSGASVNTTENRAALHTALRDSRQAEIRIDSENISPVIQTSLNKIKSLSEKIRNGDFVGATGKPIEKVVSIGVGGSDLGARMVCCALQTQNSFPTIFVSNIDPADLEQTLDNCDPEKTVFIVISKSFTTRETLENARSAIAWIKSNIPSDANAMDQIIGVTAHKDKALAYGVHPDNVFEMWDWVNGRFSLWSAVGIPIAIHSGFEAFSQLLAGAHAADVHFKSEPLDTNIPVIMGLIGIWNRNFLNHSVQAVLPYAEKLQFIPAYLQQLEMESNGKTIDRDGEEITDYDTAPVIFGETGTNGQHSFYQLLHQGSMVVPADFIGVIQTEFSDVKAHHSLLHNMLAQGQALMEGNPAVGNGEMFRYFSGNKPSSVFLLDNLNAYNLGMLLAFYEHKCFVQGIIWNINSFDQFGVELGKVLAKKLENNDLSDLDPSTKALHSLIHKDKK